MTEILKAIEEAVLIFLPIVVPLVVLVVILGIAKVLDWLSS